MSTKRKSTAVDLGEFSPTTVPETTEISLEEFARGILADPSYRRNLKDRASRGALSPVETKLLLTWGKPDKPAKKPSETATAAIYRVATREEWRMFTNLLQRALGQPESTYRDPYGLGSRPASPR